MRKEAVLRNTAKAGEAVCAADEAVCGRDAGGEWREFDHLRGGDVRGTRALGVRHGHRLLDENGGRLSEGLHGLADVARKVLALAERWIGAWARARVGGHGPGGAVGRHEALERDVCRLRGVSSREPCKLGAARRVLRRDQHGARRRARQRERSY